MIYIPSAMKFGTQSRSTSFILNMIFENCGSWPEIKDFGRFGLKIAICSNFYEMWHLVQIEYADYEYGTWNWWSWPTLLDLGKFGPNTEICTKFGTHNKSDILIMDIVLASV